jgi:hypothetical protein
VIPARIRAVHWSLRRSSFGVAGNKDRPADRPVARAPTSCEEDSWVVVCGPDVCRSCPAIRHLRRPEYRMRRRARLQVAPWRTASTAIRRFARCEGRSGHAGAVPVGVPASRFYAGNVAPCRAIGGSAHDRDSDPRAGRSWMREMFAMRPP